MFLYCSISFPTKYNSIHGPARFVLCYAKMFPDSKRRGPPLLCFMCWPLCRYRRHRVNATIVEDCRLSFTVIFTLLQALPLGRKFKKCTPTYTHVLHFSQKKTLKASRNGRNSNSNNKKNENHKQIKNGFKIKSIRSVLCCKFLFNSFLLSYYVLC